MKRLFWVVTILIVAAPVLARFSLYDFRDKLWHTAMLWAPALGVLLLLWGISAFRQSWITAFSREKRTLIWHSVVFLFLLAIGTWLLSKEREATLKICNAAPYEISFALNYNPNRLESRTEGYWNVPNGECRSVTRRFLRSDSTFHIFAASTGNLTGWLQSFATRWDLDKYEILDWTHSKNMSPTLAGHVKGQSAPWESSRQICVGGDISANTEFSFSPSSACEGGLSRRAPFVAVSDAFKIDESKNISEVWFSRSGFDLSLEICNILPYNSEVALHYKSKRAEWITEPLSAIGAGDCRSYDLNFQRVAPSYFMHSAIRGDLEKWHMNSYGGPDELTNPNVEGSVSICPSEKVHVANSVYAIANCNTQESPRAFSPGAPPLLGATNELQFIHLDGMPYPENADGTVNLSEARTEAKALRQALFRRREHRERWPKDAGKPIPYVVGVWTEQEDKYGENFRGIWVTNALYTTPFGVRVPIAPGEEIVEFNGEAIFSLEDLESGIVRFAESPENGIMKPYSVTVRRGNAKITRWGWYFFNRAAFEYSLLDEEMAEYWGGKAGWSLLGDPVKRHCAKDPDPLCDWRNRQEFWRLKQLYPNAFGRARFQTSFFQGALTLLITGPLGACAPESASAMVFLRCRAAETF